MPNIGLPELVIVLVIALVVFGPKRLPQMGRQLGQALREFRTATAEVRSQVGVDEIADSVKDIKSSFSLTGPDAAAPAAVDAGAQPATDAAMATDAIEPAAVTEPDAATEADLASAPAEAAPGEVAPTSDPTPPEPVSAPPAVAGQPPEAPGPADESGVESFGKLKRGSAPAAAPAGEGGVESFGKLKRGSATAARSSSD